MDDNAPSMLLMVDLNSPGSIPSLTEMLDTSEQLEMADSLRCTSADSLRDVLRDIVTKCKSNNSSSSIYFRLEMRENENGLGEGGGGGSCPFPLLLARARSARVCLEEEEEEEEE